MNRSQLATTPLSPADARDLQNELVERLGEAISTTATKFLCTRPERHDERAHLVSLLVELLCEGRANPKVVQAAVDIEESLFHPVEYAGAAEQQAEIEQAAEFYVAKHGGGK